MNIIFVAEVSRSKPRLEEQEIGIYSRARPTMTALHVLDSIMVNDKRFLYMTDSQTDGQRDMSKSIFSSH